MNGNDPYANDIARTLALNLNASSSSEDVIASLRNMNLGDDFWLYSYKVVPCEKSFAHRWTLCPCAHAGETARRRDPRFHPYRAVPCPLVKVKKACPMGDNCMWSHNIFEQWFHPTRYKTRLCSFGRNCSRPVCFFAHSADELRCVPQADDGKELDERDYLMQMVMAQEAGSHPHQPRTNTLQQQHSMPGPAGGGSGMMNNGAALDNMMRSLRISGSGQQEHAAQQQLQLQQQHARHGGQAGGSSSSAGAPAQQHPHQRYQQQPPPQQQFQHQHQHQHQQNEHQNQRLAGLDATSLLLGLQESLASLNLTENGWAAGGGNAHGGRISDPGTSIPHVNPIRHLNRISDSGQTLSLATPGGLASLESLLTSTLAGALSMSAPSTSPSPSQPQPSVSSPPANSSPGSQGDVDASTFAASDSQTPTLAAGPRQNDADVYVKDLVAQLRDQGIVTTKEQLVATLSQLLAQLLVAG